MTQTRPPQPDRFDDTRPRTRRCRTAGIARRVSLRRASFRRASTRRFSPVPTASSLAGVAGVVVLAILGGHPSATATPPIVTHPDPAYDRDWPAVLTMLRDKCVRCHRAGNDRADLTTFESLRAATLPDDEDAPLIVPGDPDGSPLLEYVRWNVLADPDSDHPDEPRMPDERGEWLTAGQLATLERWIAGGARRFVDAPTGGTSLCEIDFPTARQCGSCHPRQYEQWSRSMHAYAQQSPVFEAFNLTMLERTEGTLGTFCTRCHTPLGTQLGEPGTRRNVHRSRLSNEGVTCVACHRRADRRYRSSGRVSVEPGGLVTGCVYGPFDDSPAEAHGAHRAVGSVYIRTSQFCGECHDVTSPTGVRLEEAFSEWLGSPAAAAGMRCQDCHMHDNPGVYRPEDARPLGRAAVVPGVDPEDLPLRRLSDHTFAGPDYSLLPDTEFPRKLDWMYETDYRDQASLTDHQRETLRELRLANRASLAIAAEQRVRLLRNAASLGVSHPAHVSHDSVMSVDVVVKSTTAGHSLPTGFTAERQVWVHVVVMDAHGRVMFASGDVGPDGDLRDGHSAAVLRGDVPTDTDLLNLQNKFVALTHRGSERPVVLSVNRDVSPLSLTRPAETLALSFGRPAGLRVAKASLPPLASVGRTYRVPLAGTGPYTVVVRLCFRHLPPGLMDAIGTPHLKRQLETVVIDEYVGTVVTSPPIVGGGR